MKVVNVIGGLGNQMFQFALYLALKKHFPEEEVRIFMGAFRGYSKHNSYELHKVFGLNVERASLWEVARMAYPFAHYRLWQLGSHLLPQRRTMFKEKKFGHYYEKVFDRRGDCYYDGYWQNDNYFTHLRTDLLKAYTPIDIDEHNTAIARKLFSSDSVSIHVRHGDFQNNPLYQGICDTNYYRKAIARMQKETKIDTFCIFSNDLSWCQENIIPLIKDKEHIIADWNTGERSYLDMYLMSQCRHNIIANSTFSWWGAWLNQHSEKIVIGPKKWINLNTSEFKLPKEWIDI